MAFDDLPLTLPTAALAPVEEDGTLTTQPHVRLDGELARGGMGVVAEAWDGALRRPLAAKHLRSDRRTPRARAAFIAEAQLTAALEHPHILPVHTLGERDDLGPFFTMKRVEARTLLDHLREVQSRLSGDVLDDIVGILIKVCEALALAHSQGIAHCDLKASNIMVGRFGEVYLTDWGSARRFPSDDRPTTVIGTPGMMPPEQATAGPIDGRTDVFGMGALLYFVLARRSPYRRASSRASIDAAARCDFTPLSEVAPRAPAALRAISAKAMHAHPARRYPSITALRDDLDRYRRGQLTVPGRRLPAGALLIREGEVGDNVFIVTEGRFRVYRQRADGSQEDLREVGPGAVLGEAGALARAPRSASVVALTPAVVQVVSAARLEDELRRMPDWLRRVMQTLASRFHERETQS